MFWNKADGLYFSPIGFQWSSEEEEEEEKKEEDHLIDKPLMIK